MAIPTECRMPDLSGLDSPLIERLLIQLLVGERDSGSKASLYRRNFIRLIDKALGEYGEARNLILAQIAEANRPAEEMANSGRYIYMIDFTDHIETCINAVSRLFRLSRRIHSDKDSPGLPESLLRPAETRNAAIRSIRNSVEHIDEHIQKGEVSPGNPIMLTVNKEGDGIIVSNSEIKFQDLAMVLKNMNQIALSLLTLKTVSTKNRL